MSLMSVTSAPHTSPWLVSLKGLLFPPVCLICNRFMGLSAQEPVCGACKPLLPLHDQPASPTNSNLSGGVDEVFFLYRYGRAARRLVHRMKLTGNPGTGLWLGLELQRLTCQIGSHISFDAVIPVPSHRRRPLFGQDAGSAVQWSEVLGAFLKIPVIHALSRTRTVPKQTTLNRSRRLAASESALSVNTRRLDGYRSVLLADDVITTGATSDACARVLKKSGVERVTLAAIARG